ncbi:MAG TPA: intradiol ring-cleavage dioxygenase [Alphaproteobacteria bacterium]|jgi:protocatechuate 3,4-dioxygenase beta subunit
MSLVTRRALLGTAAFLGSAAALPAFAQQRLRATPPSDEGPFYPRGFPLDSDADLVQVAGRSGRARGTVAYLAGKLVNRDGRPISGAAVEIWHCDAGGVYHHVGAASRSADPNFQGYGKTRTGADGAFRFRTIKPVPYPGRTPHIHVIVAGQGLPKLTTQLYNAGEAQNERDFLFRAIAPEARAGVLMNFRPGPQFEAGALTAEMRLVMAV